jgi:hypothetical protein
VHFVCQFSHSIQMPVSLLFQNKNWKHDFMESVLRMCIDVSFSTIDIIRL